jgi:transcriptional regulator with XRE-family HTH domain
LLALDETQTQIGRVCEVTKAAVSAWFSGDALPSDSSREKLADTFEIPLSSWTQPPQGMEPEEGIDDAPIDGDPPETIEQIDRRLRMIRRVIGAGVHPKDLVPLVNAEARLLSVRAKIEDRAKLFEDRAIKQAPFMKRFFATLFAVLRKHPEALREVEEAMSEIGVIE